MTEREQLESVIAAIHAAGRCLVTAHVDPEGDSLGSQLALAEMLRELGKRVIIVDADRPPARFDFMPGIEAVVQPAQLEAKGAAVFDTAFVLDCGALTRIGCVNELLGDVPVVNIDHHGSNTRFGTVNWVEPDACATGYLLFELNERLGLSLTASKATNMYAAIITDTGNFQYSNTSPRVLEVGAQLIRSGIDPARLSQHIFGSKPLAALKLLAEGLRALRTVAGGQVGLILLEQSAFERSGAADSDVDGIVNFAKRVEGTAAGVLLRETASGEVKASFRSDGAVDVNRVAQRFGGGGHRNAAGARLAGPLDLAGQQVIAAFEEALADRRA